MQVSLRQYVTHFYIAHTCTHLYHHNYGVQLTILVALDVFKRNIDEEYEKLKKKPREGGGGEHMQ